MKILRTANLITAIAFWVSVRVGKCLVRRSLARTWDSVTWEVFTPNLYVFILVWAASVKPAARRAVKTRRVGIWCSLCGIERERGASGNGVETGPYFDRECITKPRWSADRVAKRGCQSSRRSEKCIGQKTRSSIGKNCSRCA